MKKKTLSVLLVALLALTAIFATSCGGSSSSETVKIAIPNDATNEARALLLLDANGYIKLKDGAGITATLSDIEDANGIEFEEVEAAQVSQTLQDVDFGIINANYAIDADLNPVDDNLIIESSAADYANIVGVKEGNENEDWAKALIAAFQSQAVADFIASEYGGAVVSVVENPGDGLDATVDYDKLNGTTITIACSPAPHAEIAKEAAKILATKGITLDVKEFTDYVQPNNVVESGEVDANYFQHIPYLDDFNTQNNTHIVSIGTVHNEPMALYAGKSTSLDALSKLN